jgi:hypothetical protein
MYLNMTCRICGGARVYQFLDLGDQPHCNRLVPRELLGEKEPNFPLRVGFCEDCTLVQIDHTIPKESMFSNYPYVSGTTKTLTQHFQATADRLCERYKPGAGSYVVDIGSNDGSWLSCYARHHLAALGVEPAANVAALARERGIETINDFFSESVANTILAERGPAALVTAAGVFFHLEELHSVTRGVASLLGEQGVFVVQAIYLGGMIENTAFDQIYHEHLCYYTLRTLERLFDLHGLEVIDVSVVPIHGGSLEVHAAKKGTRPVAASVDSLRRDERAKGYGELATFEKFAARVWKLRDELLSVLKDYRARGKSVYAYGAPAKGATLLNSFHIDSQLVQAAAEKNPIKIGYYIPGCRIPIIDEGEQRPDAYLMLAWNFLSEFLQKDRGYLEDGGQFIVPIPHIHVMTGADIA